MELRLVTARETVGYKEAAGFMDTMRGLMPGGQTQPTTPQAPQFQNVQEMAQQLGTAWRTFANLYNQQIQPLKAAYKHVEMIIRTMKAVDPDNNLLGEHAQKIQGLIDTLNQAVQGENQDVQVLSNINQTVTELAGALGMQGEVGQMDPTTGKPIGQATPEENAALQGMAPQETPQETPQVAPQTAPDVGTPTPKSSIEPYGVTPEPQAAAPAEGAAAPAGGAGMPATRPAPQPGFEQPLPADLGPAAPVEQVTPQTAPAAAASPMAPQAPTPTRQMLRNIGKGKPEWVQQRAQQGVDEATAIREFDAAYAPAKARKSKRPPSIAPSAASASVFVKIV
jgi:hypothetical protein